MVNKKLVRMGYTKLLAVPGLEQANKLSEQINEIIDNLNNNLKFVSNKINAKIL